jgi:hypothetical protein
VEGDVPGARHHHGAPVERAATHAEHLQEEEDDAVARGLHPSLRTTPSGVLAGEHARLVPVGQPLVLAEEPADLPCAHPDVAGRHVGVLAEVTVQLGHEALAEAHDLGVGAPPRVEVGPALATTELHAGEGVLDHLLEAEELHDAEVDRRVEPQPALVRAECAVELHAHAAVELDLAGVVLPRDAEDDLALRLAEPLQDLLLGVLGPPHQERVERLEHLEHGLVELGLARVAPHDVVVDRCQ